MVAFKHLLGVLALIHQAMAEEYDFTIYKMGYIAYSACSGLVAKTATYVSEEDLLGYCSIDNQQGLGTMAICLQQLPSDAGKNYFLNLCAPLKLTESQYLDAYHNATKHMVNVTAEPGFNATLPYYKPAMIPAKKVQSAIESSKMRYYNYNLGSWFGIALMCYWYFVVLMSGVAKFIHFAFPGLIKSLKGPFVNTYRRYVTLAPTGQKSHAHHKVFLWIFEWISPTRYETILIAGWWIMALVFNVVRYHHVDNNLFWPKSQSAEIGRYIADRTGVMVLFLIPTLILFGGRNNFLQWVSGWSYSRFLIIHRWIARASTILVILHAVGMTYNGKGIGKYDTRNQQEYMHWGFVALVCMCLLCFHSMLVLRKSQYELFILCHVIFAVLFVVGGWRHTEDQGYQQFFFAATAVWVFDRVVRIIRLFSFGVHSATVELKANETLRVTMKRPAYWVPFPGCHAYIHFLRPSCFWQSHPFTIVDSVSEDRTITFYLKVKGGVTHGLYKFLSNQPDKKAQIKVTVEGPYGQRIPVSRYENVTLLAGGNGIPGPYYEARSLEKSSLTSSVKLIWVIRHYRSLEWFFEELMKLKGSKVHPIIYVTQPHLGEITPDMLPYLNSSDEEEQEEKKSEIEVHEESAAYIQKIKSKLLFVEFREGRPQVEELVKSDIQESDGAIAFVTCAHPGMVDDARVAIARNLSVSSNRVDLFEQIQSW